MESSAIIHVPFRCPDCGDALRFESLKDLRLHLQTEHAELNIKTRKTSQFPPNLFTNRSATPILEMFHADAVRIEEDLRTHKRNELNNKQKRMNAMSSANRSPNTVRGGIQRSTIRQLDNRSNKNPSSFRKYGHSGRVEEKYLNKLRTDKGDKSNKHGFNYSSNKYLEDNFKDDESLNDVTRPDVTVSRNIPRQINKIHNIPPSDFPRNSDPSTRLPESVSSDMDNHVRETLTSLSQEVVLTRANQQHTVDSLIASQEVYSSLQQSAQDKLCKQQEIIATLALKLSEKDERLADLTVQVNSMKHLTAEEEVKNLFRMKSNQESEKMLHEELFYKQKELAALTQRVENAKLAVLKCEREGKNKNEDSIMNSKDKAVLDVNFDSTEKPEREINTKPLDGADSGEDNRQEKQSVSFPVTQARLVERDMLAKEKELVSLRSKSMQLESDRQTLLLEMQALLEIAANDNEKLRAELANQGKQLSKLNLELERSKQEQSELLGETNTLYFQADLSLSRLKHVLEERDSQLSSVSAQLEQAKEMQGKLTKEGEEYLNAAVEKEANYQALVQENALQLKNMRESLAKRQLEKENLQAKLSDLKNELTRKEKKDIQMEERMMEMESQLEQQEAWQVSMKEQIRRKEDRLHSAKQSMDQMNSFMSETAKRELEARSRLEQFISNLIERSTQTETELKRLKDAYEAKEKAFKDLIEAQKAQLPSKQEPLHFRKEEERSQSHPSWQTETQRELQSLSSYPSPTASRRLNGFADINTPNQIYPLSPTQYNHRLHQTDYYDDEEVGEAQEPTRLRSTINHVKKNEPSNAIPQRQLKNRPILVLGKEYPHSSAYGANKATSRTVNAPYQSSTEKLDNGDHVRRNKEKPKRRPLYEDRFYLPVESDGYTLPTESRPAHTKSGKSHSHVRSESHHSNNRPQMDKDTSPHRLNNSPLFRNTPEVERMYQNVQKHAYNSNPSNQFSNRGHSNPQNSHPLRGQRLEQLPMDEQGIIWGPYNRAGLRTKPQKKKVKRKPSAKLNNSSTNKHHSDSEEIDDDIPSSQKRNEQSRRSQSQPPFLRSPAPLGDKIATLLTSIGPVSMNSAARREYVGNTSTTSTRPNNERDVALSYSASDSDSQHSSPIHDARAVRERVEKLTATQNRDNRDRAISPTPRVRKTMNQPIKHNDENGLRAINSSGSHPDEYNEDAIASVKHSRDSIPVPHSHENSVRPLYSVGIIQIANETDRKDNTRKTVNLQRQRSQESEIVSKDPSQLLSFIEKQRIDEDRADLETIPEKSIEDYYQHDTSLEINSNDEVMDASNYPFIEVMKPEEEQIQTPEVYYDDSDVMSPPPHDDTDGATYQSSHLLNPYNDRTEQFESHNAESDFSSSSYATIGPQTTTHKHTEDTEDYTADTQEDDVNEDSEPNTRLQTIAQIHRELESSIDAEKKQDSDDNLEEDTEERVPSVSEMRERFQQSPMPSKESYFSRSSDSNRTSLLRNNSLVKSNSYDSVMKELLQKHPYINQRSQEQDLLPSSNKVAASQSESRIYDASEHISHNEIVQEQVNPVENRLEEYDASDNGKLSSSDDFDNDEIMQRQETPSRPMSRADTMDASTDTDLEKMAMPGAAYKPFGGKKKKKNAAGMKKERKQKQKAAATPRLKDMARNSWTSVDADDPDEAERQERLAKRRVRVALFCALAFADTQSLLSASQVCKDWRKIAHHPALWKHVVLKDSQITSQENIYLDSSIDQAHYWDAMVLCLLENLKEFLITLSQWCTQAQTLRLQGLQGRTQRLMESEEDYHKSIRGSLESGLERLLFACQGSLTSLSIEGCENILTDKCLWLVSSNCRMLTHLTYRSCVDPINPQLTWAIGGGCPGITSLYVHPYPDSDVKNAMTNRCLLQIGQFYRDMQEVGLGGMEFNMAGLLPFIQSCQHLTSIHMDSCLALTDDLATGMCRAGLKDLQVFTITGTAFQAKAITTLHANCRHLKKIHATVTPQSCGFDMSKKKEKEEYKKLIKGYKDLKKKAGLAHILTMDIQEI